MDPILSDLTEPQREAVLHTEGPLLVLAGAGSGKTRVITRRIAHLARLGVAPWRILALTFTNKAAGEMRQRVEALLGEGVTARGLTVTTFHSLGARLVRRYAEAANLPGIRADYTIYDAADQAALMKKVIAGLDLSTGNWPPRSVLAAISAAKNRMMDAGAFAMAAGDFYGRTVARIYAAYEEALRAANAVDFDDLLVLTARMLRSSVEIRGECRGRWRYLLIDEYQDTNHVQFVISSVLAGETGGDGVGPNICVVGDPDQSIYGWRGADITNILEFEAHYPSARVIALGQNFRSTAPILAAADRLIRHNVRRKHKDLFTARTGGCDVAVVYCRDEHHEALFTVDWFKSLHEGRGREGDADSGEGGGSAGRELAWREMAVFYRTNALSRVIEDELRTAGVPYVVARGTAFYEREEVRDAVSYLRVLANPADEVSLLRILNKPPRGIGATTVKRVQAFAALQDVDLFSALRRAGEVPGLSERAVGAAGRFVAMVDTWSGAGTFLGTQTPGSLADLVGRVIRESSLEGVYARQARASGSDADAERVDNLNELVSSARDFELGYDPAADPAAFAGGDAAEPAGAPQTPPLLALLRAYLERIALVSDADTVDPSQGAVTLMTLHASKGLEFGAVAMIGLEDGVLPHARSRESEAELEEERRLCFVGMTRAMRHLQLTSAARRTIRGVPERTIRSPFLDELGGEHVRVSDQSDALVSWTDDEIDQRTIEERLTAARALGARASKTASLIERYPEGSLVRHPQFGIGRVLQVTGGVSGRAKVRFQSVGVKTLVLEFARLERLA